MPSISTPSRQFDLMELACALPRMLDSQRPDGGVMRLLSNPGGKLNTIRAIHGPDGDLDPTVALDRLHMLIQHPHEVDEDFSFRAMVTAPVSGYWHSVEALAGRPFSRPVQVVDVPPLLKPGGEWYDDIDLQGNSLSTFLSRHSRYAVGYGLGYIATLFSSSANRPYWRWVPRESVIWTSHDDTGLTEIRIQGQTADGRVSLHVYAVGDKARLTPCTFAVYEAEEGSDDVGDTPTDAGVLEGTAELPFRAYAAGPLSRQHFIQPLYLAAASLDYQLLQVTSNNRYAAIIANTFLRFAKGLDDRDLDNWVNMGPSWFYGTTNKDADMKFVTVDPGAIESSRELEDHILRHIEVAGNAPMMTRMPGDEKAFGQSMAESRARSASVSIALSWQSSGTSALRDIAFYAPQRTGGETLVLNTSVGLSPESWAHAQQISSLYLDPRGGMGRPEYWRQLQSLGMDIDIDPEDLARWAETANPERAKLGVERAGVLAQAFGKNGMLSVRNPAHVRLAVESLIDHGVITPRAVEAVGGVERALLGMDEIPLPVDDGEDDEDV